MPRNITMVERVVRAVIGLVILGLYGALTPPWRYLALLGLLPLGTALTGYCPTYRALGWNRGGAGGSGRDRTSSRPS